MNRRNSVWWIVPALLAFIPCAHADVAVAGDNVTATTPTMIVTFRGGDIVKLFNRTTAEEYIHTVGRFVPSVDMELIPPAETAVHTTGWRIGRVTNQGFHLAAQTYLRDLQRTVWLNLVIDEETQDVTLNTWGDARRDGVKGLRWGIRGLDLTAGKLILPAFGGVYADSENLPESLTLRYPSEWEANMLVWQQRGGGFVLYSRDEKSLFKRLHIRRHGQYMDLEIETEAVAPWKKADVVPQCEWRMNAFKGDWRVPAGGYRNLMHFVRKPIPATDPRDSRAWVNTIRGVVTVRGQAYDPALLDALAQKLDAKKTLLYLPDWRNAGFDAGYPDYTPCERARSFIEKAHDLGFRVMLHAHLAAVAPGEDLARVQRFQVRDAEMERPIGHRLDAPESDKTRYAVINPASRTFRNLLVARIKAAVDDLRPDAIQLGGSNVMWNDGNGPIDELNYSQGAASLCRALLTAFPTLALSGEEMNEQISPFCWFASRRPPIALSPHPISSFLFGDRVLPWADPGRLSGGLTEPETTGQEERGITHKLEISSAADLSNPGILERCTRMRLWQDHDLTPDWTGDWTESLFRWRGTDGTAAVLERKGPLTRLRLGEQALSQRVRGVSTLATSLYVPGWLAYNDGSLFGLDPNREYTLEAMPRPADLPHLSALSPNAIIISARFAGDFLEFDLKPRRAADTEPATADLTLPSGMRFETIEGASGLGSSTGPVIHLTAIKLPGTLRFKLAKQ